MAFGPTLTQLSVVEELNVGLTGNQNIIIKGYNTVVASINIFPNGVAFSEDLCIFRNGDNKPRASWLNKQTDTWFIYSCVFDNVTDREFEFSVEDVKGGVSRLSYTVPDDCWVDYNPVTCTISNNKPNGSGDMTVECSGSWYNGSFGVANNMLAVWYRYAEAGQDIENASWTVMTVSVSGNSYSASAYLTGLNYQKTYIFEVKAYDLLSEAKNSNYGVKGAPVFHWGNNDVTFEVPANFNQPVNFNAGTSGINIYDIAGLQYGEWYPALVNANIYSTTAMNGWYLKVGNVVTIGFYIKAVVRLSDACEVRIDGNPFSPVYRASGGGICSGVKISDGLNFQCFVAEESGVITTRAQDCEPQTDQHLHTSASGCYYPMNAGEITLSGTITYLTD